MVLGRAWRFIKRHRGRLALSGVVVGGAYLLHWWLQRQRTRHGGEDDEVTALLSELERAQFLRSTGQNCAATVAALLPGLAAQLEADLGVEQITAELRAKPAPERRTELCDRLRARAFGRLLAGVYAVCGSVLCVHVQLHVLAGLLYQQKRAAAEGAVVGDASDAEDDGQDGGGGSRRRGRESQISDDVKIRFLGLLDTRAHAGQLAAELEAHCLAECAGCDMRDKVGLRRLDSLLHRLRLGFEARAGEQGRRLLPSMRDGLLLQQRVDGPADAGRQHERLLLQRLCSEADARLASPEAGRVFKRLLDAAGLALLRVFTAHYQGLESQAPLHERSLPMLKVLPLINSTAGLLLTKQFLDTSGLADSADLLRFSADLFDSLSGGAGSGREMS